MELFEILNFVDGLFMKKRFQSHKVPVADVALFGGKLNGAKSGLQLFEVRYPTTGPTQESGNGAQIIMRRRETVQIGLNGGGTPPAEWIQNVGRISIGQKAFNELVR